MFYLFWFVLVFFLRIRRPPRSTRTDTLFPYTTLCRSTFANIRLRNQLAPGTEGGFTRDFTKADAPVSSIYDASVNYLKARIPPVILTGKEYGSGSSRDRAAKGTALLGVRAGIGASYERIHRSNPIGHGGTQTEGHPPEIQPLIH